MRVVEIDFDFDFQKIQKCTIKEDESKDLTPLDDYDQQLPPLAGSIGNGESTNHVAFDMKSTLVSVKVMARHLLAEMKLKKDIKLINLEDHQ